MAVSYTHLDVYKRQANGQTAMSVWNFTIYKSSRQAFFSMLNPELKNKPLAVCDPVEERHGIVLAKNLSLIHI